MLGRGGNLKNLLLISGRLAHGATNSVARTKGITLTHARSYAEKAFGPGAWERVLAKSSVEDRTNLGGIVAVGWYDLGLYARTLRAMDAALGRADLALLDDLNRYGAEKDFTTVYRLFFRMGSPIYAIEKTADYWRKFHDTGTWSIEREGAGRARGVL